MKAVHLPSYVLYRWIFYGGGEKVTAWVDACCWEDGSIWQSAPRIIDTAGFHLREAAANGYLFLFFTVNLCLSLLAACCRSLRNRGETEGMSGGGSGPSSEFCQWSQSILGWADTDAAPSKHRNRFKRGYWCRWCGASEHYRKGRSWKREVKATWSFETSVKCRVGRVV